MTQSLPRQPELLAEPISVAVELRRKSDGRLAAVQPDRRRDEPDPGRLDDGSEGPGGGRFQRLERSAHGPGRNAGRAARLDPLLSRPRPENLFERGLQRRAILDARGVGTKREVV